MVSAANHGQSSEESTLLTRLRAGDEAAFIALVDRYAAAMLRVARAYVHDDAAAEEVVQDAWLGVLRGIDRFEGRASLKSWIFTIVVNRAKTRGVRDARTVPFSALAHDEAERDDPSVAPDRFRPPDAPEWPGHWKRGAAPASWGADPLARLTSAETLRTVRAAIDALPPAQRTVVTLRDLAGATTEEICNMSGLTETNVRVLLHRGRAKVRAALEESFR